MNQSTFHINIHLSHTSRRLFSFFPPFQLLECDLKAWISENFCFHSQNKYKTIDRILIDSYCLYL